MPRRPGLSTSSAGGRAAEDLLPFCRFGGGLGGLGREAVEVGGGSGLWVGFGRCFGRPGVGRGVVALGWLWEGGSVVRVLGQYVCEYISIHLVRTGPLPVTCFAHEVVSRMV